MTPQPASEPPSPGMSEIARLTGVFTDPKRAFQDIAAKPRWWVPLSLLVILALAFNVSFSRRVGWERFMNQTFDSNPRTQNMPPEQRARAIEQGTKIASVMAYVGAIAGVPLFALLVALALMLVFNVSFGAQLRFPQTFGVTSYAILPRVISASLAILVMFLKNPDDFNLENPLAFNIGAFLDPQASPKWLVSLGSSLDLFSIWTIVLLAIGMSVAARKVTFGKALAAVSIPWGVLIVVKSALSGLRG
jgi:Yip1 domain